MRSAGFLLGLGLLAGCVRATWSRDTRFEPVPEAALAGLEAGTSDLASCLATLGAPLFVWEDAHGGASGAALAYGWFDQRALGLRVSIPVRGFTASVDYDQIDARLRGLVLFFDPDWRLTQWRLGLLAELTRELRRPAAVAEDA